MEHARQENKLNPKKRPELGKNRYQTFKPSSKTGADPKKGENVATDFGCMNLTALSRTRPKR
jgi:hypothetical protein